MISYHYSAIITGKPEGDLDTPSQWYPSYNPEKNYDYEVCPFLSYASRFRANIDPESGYDTLYMILLQLICATKTGKEVG